MKCVKNGISLSIRNFACKMIKRLMRIKHAQKVPVGMGGGKGLIEIKDIKDSESSSDDVNIEPIAKGDANESEEDFWKRATARNVAVIELHKSESDPDPRMPQLQAQFPGLPEGLSVKWRFVCKSRADIAVIAGCITGVAQTGDYCYWHDAQGNWALSRFNSWNFNYVDRVCEEVESL